MRQGSPIVGRDEELARLRRLLAEDGPSAVVIDGEAGIGKSTLWRHVLDEAPREWRVLAARPAENEASLPYSALGDLLEPLLDETSPEREVLEPPLRGRTGEAPARLAVARATLALLRRAAGEAPLLLALDDVQWLDAASAEVLEFAARRLEGAEARVFVARRTDVDALAPLGLERAALRGGLDHIRIQPLDVTAIGDILLDRLALRLPRPRLIELHRASGGSPFYALEIGRALQALGDAEDGGPLPIPDRAAALRSRLDALSPAARFAALLAAASAHPTANLLHRAADDVAGLAECTDAGVLVVEGDRLRFVHPLLGSATYAAAAPWERQHAHTRLARAAVDRLERARHLSEAADEPDEAVAGELADAAAEAAARGAPGTAARLLERAAELTPPADEATRRHRLAGVPAHHVASGDPSRAARLLERLIASMPPGPERADLLRQLADVEHRAEKGKRVAEQAVAEAAGAPAIGARAYLMLATLSAVTGDRLRAAEHARTATELAREADDELLVALATGDLCQRLMMLGLPYPREELERATEIEQRLPDDVFPAFQRPSFQLGIILGYTDEPDRARPLLAAELARLEAAGNDSWQIGVLLRLADVELRAGDWGAAGAYARRCRAIASSGGTMQERTVASMVHGLVQAHLGNLAEAAAAASEALALAEEGGDRAYGTRSAAVLGFVELSRGDAATALERLAPAGRELRASEFGELSIAHVVQNEIEALVLVGQLEEAEAVIAYTEEKGRPTQRSWHEAIAARGRALVAAARGDADAARAHVARALAAHERLPQPFELGRTLLAQGTIERRAKRRAEARAALTQALELFDALGAPLWAEKAANELARIPGRAKATGDLSETERKIADLAASGLPNKEIAARLFVTVRTVEGNLTRIYSKLGVRSRTELASLLARKA